MMSANTLSHKLFIRIAPTIILTILLIGSFAFVSATKEIDTVYDAQLISNANVLWSIASKEVAHSHAAAPSEVADIDLSIDNLAALNESADDYANLRMFRIWKGGKIAMLSDTAIPSNIGRQSAGFSTLTVNGDKWRIYTLPIQEKDISIEVGERVELRDTLVMNILIDLAFPLLLLVPIVGFLLWKGIRAGLGTIRELIQQIQNRSPDDLSSIKTCDLPDDIIPLASSLNQLLSKLDSSLDAEKRFADDAAHQLRTPLATIKLQLQMILRAKDETAKTVLIQKTLSSNERAIKLVAMLLASARMSHQPINRTPLNIYQALAEVMADLGPLSAQKQIEMKLEGDTALTIKSDPELIQILASNLIENAIKYTPEHGLVDVSVRDMGASCLLCISDTGPGLSESEKELVFTRFYRGQTSQADGSGLGLAIVAEIVKRLNGTISLEKPESGTGLLARVQIPKD